MLFWRSLKSYLLLKIYSGISAAFMVLLERQLRLTRSTLQRKQSWSALHSSLGTATETSTCALTSLPLAKSQYSCLSNPVDRLFWTARKLKEVQHFVAWTNGVNDRQCEHGVIQKISFGLHPTSKLKSNLSKNSNDATPCRDLVVGIRGWIALK